MLRRVLETSRQVFMFYLHYLRFLIVAVRFSKHLTRAAHKYPSRTPCQPNQSIKVLEDLPNFGGQGHAPPTGLLAARVHA
jgi:hypothetical protein